MNGKEHKCCEVCGRPTPRDWNGVYADHCRVHRVIPDSEWRAVSEAEDSKRKSVFGHGISMVFSVLAGVIAVIAETPPGHGKSDERQTSSLSDIAYYPGKEYDDAGKPLGWVGYGHDPDTDRHFGPPSDWV